MKVTEKTHAKLGPSGWDWWSNCSYAPTLCEGLPNPSSRYAAQGTVAHEISDRVLSDEAVDAGVFLGQVFQVDGFDIEVDDEMVEASTAYTDYVRSRIDDGGVLLNEVSVPIGHLTGETGATGTADAIIVNGNRLIVIDLKYGKGVRVNAEGNGQARMYALGALHMLSSVYEVAEVETVIVHPRLESGITSELLSIGELQEFQDEVELAAGRVLIATEDDLNPGEKQCKFCPARNGTCPALNAELSRNMQLVAPATAQDFADLTMPKQAAAIAVNEGVTSEKLSEFLRAVPLIEAAITAARAEAERRLFAGEGVPGFYLGMGRKGNRKWVDGAEEELRKRLTVAEAYEKKLISVPTAEKLFKKKPKTWVKIKDLITQSEGKPSVCKEGDGNPVYTPVTATDFADLSAQTEADRLLS